MMGLALISFTHINDCFRINAPATGSLYPGLHLALGIIGFTPILEYACQVWHPGLTDYLAKDIERIQKRALWVIYPEKSYEESLNLTKLTTLSERRDQACRAFVKSMKSKDHKLHHLIPSQKVNNYTMRRPMKYEPPKLKTYRAKGSLINWYLCNLKDK